MGRKANNHRPQPGDDLFFFRPQCGHLFASKNSAGPQTVDPRKNEHSPQILTRNNLHGSHLHLFTKRMLKIVKKLFSPPFSCAQIPPLLRECENIAPNTKNGINTHLHLSCLLFVLTYSRQITINVNPALNFFKNYLLRIFLLITQIYQHLLKSFSSPM